MKKFLSILLALTMVLSLGTAAFAEDNNSKTFETVVDNAATTEEVENAASFDVTAKANVIPEGAYANIEYAVKVEWQVEIAEIEINGGTVYKWNPSTFKYEVDTGEGGDKLGKDTVGVQITLTNRSNAAVTYEIVYADNDADKLTTEAGAVADKDGKAQVTGDLGSADIIVDLAKASENESFDYDIAIDKQGEDDKGEAQTKTYKDTVKVTAIAADANLGNAADLTLGTYTVTLGKYVAPTPEPEEPVVKTIETVGDILDTVEGGFPGLFDENSWKDRDDKNQFIGIFEGRLSANGGSWTMDTSVSNGENGYVVVEDNENRTITLTFVMTDNVLTSIKYDYVVKAGPEEMNCHYVYAPAAE